MTAQPSSQAEREDVAREVLAATRHAESCAIAKGYVRCTCRRVERAMLAFSDREHATPRSMPEEVDHGQ